MTSFEEEEDFPRGSATVLTPLEIKTAQEQAKRDTPFVGELFHSSSQKEGGQRKRRKEDVLQFTPLAKKGSRSHAEVRFPSPNVRHVPNNPNTLYRSSQITIDNTRIHNLCMLVTLWASVPPRFNENSHSQ